MADDTDLYALLIAEILVIVHLACDESIGSSGYSLVEQEIPCPATDGHLGYLMAQQFITQGTLHIEGILYSLHEVARHLWLLQFTDDTTTSLDTTNVLWCHEPHIVQPQLLGHLEVHTTLRIVHVSMHRDDADIIPDGLSHRALHVCQVADGLQSTEQQRMVADNQVAALLNGLVNNLFVDVQTQ